MYQEDHGIIHNKFYDKKLGKEITFGSLRKQALLRNNSIFEKIGNQDDGQWADPRVEPIWITATKQVDNFLTI